MKRKDIMERSEKRSPYDSYDSDRSRNRRNRPKGSSVGFVILTLILLLVLFPVGIFFLWSRKIRWSAGAKLFVMIVTGIVFTGLMILAINYDTGNPRITQIQKEARIVLEKVDGYTGNTIQKVTEWSKGGLEDVKEVAAKLYEASDERVASEALKYYSEIDENLYAVKVELPKLLLEKFKSLIDYTPSRKETNVPVMLATPDMGGLNVTPSNQATEKEPEVQTTPAPVQPTATPESTPTPAPTKAPIVLPEIKDVALAEVFYTQGGTYYHAKTNCSGMMNAVSHTLKEAQSANKKVCDSCGVVSFGMMECANYLWVDTKNRAHTTDECLEFAPGAYKVLPFDDVYNGSYNYCAECKSTVCYDYMLENDLRYVKDSEILDEERIALYEYEKGVTVYYGVNSRNYHATAECMHMTGDKYIHTLYQALHVDMKQVCELCKPLTENQVIEMIRSEIE
ncbi:MAG: PT domain-containing protein [Clostridia bacterium]|nr:PT domain-containing protein [Clostridia bacterium]